MYSINSFLSLFPLGALQKPSWASLDVGQLHGYRTVYETPPAFCFIQSMINN